MNEPVLFENIMFNSMIVLLNEESIPLLIADMLDKNMFAISIIRDSENDLFKQVVANKPIDMQGTITGLVIGIQYKENYKA